MILGRPTPRPSCGKAFHGRHAPRRARTRGRLPDMLAGFMRTQALAAESLCLLPVDVVELALRVCADARWLISAGSALSARLWLRLASGRRSPRDRQAVAARPTVAPQVDRVVVALERSRQREVSRRARPRPAAAANPRARSSPTAWPRRFPPAAGWSARTGSRSGPRSGRARPNSRNFGLDQREHQSQIAGDSVWQAVTATSSAVKLMTGLREPPRVLSDRALSRRSDR